MTSGAGRQRHHQPGAMPRARPGGAKARESHGLAATTGLRPAPPPNGTWRVCGQPVTADPGCGCDCAPHDPTAWKAERALTHMSCERVEKGEDR